MMRQSDCVSTPIHQAILACSSVYRSYVLKQEQSSLGRLKASSLVRDQLRRASYSLHAVQKLDRLIGARKIVDRRHSAFTGFVIRDTNDLEQSFFSSGANGAVTCSVPSVKRGLLNIGNGVNEFRFHDVSPKWLSGVDIVIQNQDMSTSFYISTSAGGDL